MFLQDLKPLFRIELIVLTKKKKQEKGPTLKPSLSKLGTYQGRNSFTFTYPTQFESGIFECVWPSLQQPPGLLKMPPAPSLQGVLVLAACCLQTFKQVADLVLLRWIRSARLLQYLSVPAVPPVFHLAQYSPGDSATFKALPRSILSKLLGQDCVTKIFKSCHDTEECAQSTYMSFDIVIPFEVYIAHRLPKAFSSPLQN